MSTNEPNGSEGRRSPVDTGVRSNPGNSALPPELYTADDLYSTGHDQHSEEDDESRFTVDDAKARMDEQWNSMIESSSRITPNNTRSNHTVIDNNDNSPPLIPNDGSTDLNGDIKDADTPTSILDSHPSAAHATSNEVVSHDNNTHITDPHNLNQGTSTSVSPNTLGYSQSLLVNIHCSPLFRDDIFEKMRADNFPHDASTGSLGDESAVEMMHHTPRHKDKHALHGLHNIPETANEDANEDDQCDEHSAEYAGRDAYGYPHAGDADAAAGAGSGAPSVLSEHEGGVDDGPNAYDGGYEEDYPGDGSAYGGDPASDHEFATPGAGTEFPSENDQAPSTSPHSHSAGSVCESVAASDLELNVDADLDEEDEEEGQLPQQHWLKVRRPAMYLSWPGRSLFACKGRCVWGPQWVNVIYSVLLILVPVALFLAFPARSYPDVGLGEWPSIVAAVLTVASLVTIALAAGSNPGLIPRRVEGPQAWQRRQPVMASGRTHTVKYCSTCNIFRPPRAFHCNICDACVSRFDHHCPWLGTCVGRGNYHYFLWFLASVMSLCLFILATSIAAPVVHAQHIQDLHPGMGFWDAFDTHRAPSVIAWVLALYGLLVAVFIAWLTGFHVMLIWNGVTTVEHLKRVYDGEKHPESRGCLNNLGGLCFSNDRDRAIHERETVHVLVEMSANPEDVIPEIEKQLAARKSLDDVDIEMAVIDLTKGVLVGRERGDRELANRGVEFISEW